VVLIFAMFLSAMLVALFRLAANPRDSAGRYLLLPLSWRGTGVGTSENPGN
jgi:hypothetical protein